MRTRYIKKNKTAQTSRILCHCESSWICWWDTCIRLC